MKLAHWTDLENAVEARLKALLVHFPLFYLRLYDTKSAGNYLPAQPCDFLIWTPNRSGIFLEVKYSSAGESLRSVFSNNVSDQQLASARLAHRAGQHYLILFYSAASKCFELWDGKYCADRRSMGKPLELLQRRLSQSLHETLEVGVLGLDEEKLRRMAVKTTLRNP
jgi:hypothetical protein